MDIIIYATDPAATAALVARALGCRPFEPPCRNHPDRWRGGDSSPIAIVEAGPDTPPAGVYLALGDRAVGRLPELVGRPGGTWRLPVEAGAVPCAPALPLVETREESGHQHYILPLLTDHRAAITAVAASIGCGNPRFVGPAFVRRYLDEGVERGRDPGFRLVVDGPADADLSELEAFVAKVHTPTRHSEVRVAPSGAFDADTLRAIERKAWWLDEDVRLF